jgi:hypothetical protein
MTYDRESPRIAEDGLGTRTTGTIQFGVRDARVGSVPVTFSRDEMNRLSQIINQAKGTLDSVRR